METHRMRIKSLFCGDGVQGNDGYVRVGYAEVTESQGCCFMCVWACAEQW